ncbi:MAG TPA: pyridoxamine 5'-phosphate oxidase family protein [Candidatus Limnocylindrales bacterium]|nr:pyridoxamine 5'-phosphate oxidase family protein [Candidatus Limnocylindrales bacterium]
MADEATIPEDLSYLLTTNVPAHLTAVAADGSLVSYVVWVDYDGQRILTSSPVGSAKGRRFRKRAQVALSVLDPKDAWRRLSISGHVVDIQPDEGLTLTNKLSQRYTGSPYPRPDAREIFSIEPDKVRAFRGRASGPRPS